MESVTCIAPVNIAVIKYWGKRDEKLKLPLNDSISVTLDHLYSKTSIATSAAVTESKLWLNQKAEDFANPRITKCIEDLRRRAEKLCLSNLDKLQWNVNICSENNFPTAAGLASSASGYACLVYTLASLYEMENTELTSIARVGSGSACRSIYGGFVQWKRGELDDGSDSIAIQIAPASHWPALSVLILVVSDTKKKTSSTDGMSRSVATSQFLKYRASDIVPGRIERMTKAILDRDFESFAEITMQDSNQFHGICLDTYPPCVYMNDISHSIADLVHKYNSVCGKAKIAYTFDAGPNACLYLLDEDVADVVGLLNHFYPNDNAASAEYIKGHSVVPADVAQGIKGSLNASPADKNALKYIIHAKVGDGPRKLEKSASLLAEATGIPLFLS